MNSLTLKLSGLLLYLKFSDWVLLVSPNVRVESVVLLLKVVLSLSHIEGTVYHRDL